MRSTPSDLLANKCLIVTESNTVLKLKFQKLQPTVVNNVNPANIIDFLFSKGVISDDDMEALQKVKDKEDAREQCRKLLTLLHVSDHPQAFIQLYAAIKNESHLQWLVDRIDNESVIDLLQQLYISEPTGCVNMCFSDYYIRPRSAERYSDTLRLSVCMTLHMITETPLKLRSSSELHTIILILRHPVLVCMSLGGKGQRSPWQRQKVGTCGLCTVIVCLVVPLNSEQTVFSILQC